jgi:hypothetical protein
MTGEGEQQGHTIVAWLRDPAHAERCAAFPADAARAAHAGMYAWYGDETAAKPSAATLASRIGGNHIRGNTRGSTFRRTWAALLWDALDLRCAKERTLDPESNQRLTDWMLEHLSVAIAPVDDRAAIDGIESHVLDALDPPLNLNKVASTPSRKRLRELRRQLAG